MSGDGAIRLPTFLCLYREGPQKSRDFFLRTSGLFWKNIGTFLKIHQEENIKNPDATFATSGNILLEIKFKNKQQFYFRKYFLYSFSKFGVNTPFPIFSRISCEVQNRPPANSSWLGFTSPS